MQTAARGATCFVAACLLGGCGSSSAVRQAKLNDPIIVVTVQSTPNKPKDQPKKPLVEANKVAKADVAKDEESRIAILGALSAMDPGDPNGVFGGVVGGVIGGPSQGFGGLGLSGGGVGAGGTGGGFGLGSIGTIGRGSSYRGSSYRAPGERTKAKFGNVVITGPLTLDVVQRHIDDHRDDIQHCHRLEQSGNVSRWGTATFQFTIDATGHVSDVHVYDSTLGSHDLENCIAHTIGAYEFPPLGSGNQATIRLPITF